MRKRPALPELGGVGNGDLSHSSDATRKDEHYCRMLRSQSNLEAEWWQSLSGCFLEIHLRDLTFP